MTKTNEELLELAIQDGVREGVKTKLSGYSSPLDDIIKSVLNKHGDKFRSLLESSIQSAIGDETFADQIRNAVRHKLANVLIARFGGEMEKQVNALKSDPVTRARITVAIEEIVKDRIVTA